MFVTIKKVTFHTKENISGIDHHFLCWITYHRNKEGRLCPHIFIYVGNKQLSNVMLVRMQVGLATKIQLFLAHSLTFKPIFHCNMNPFTLGLRVG